MSNYQIFLYTTYAKPPAWPCCQCKRHFLQFDVLFAEYQNGLLKCCILLAFFSECHYFSHLVSCIRVFAILLYSYTNFQRFRTTLFWYIFQLMNWWSHLFVNKMANPLGLEPRMKQSKCLVLPLHHGFTEGSLTMTHTDVFYSYFQVCTYKLTMNVLRAEGSIILPLVRKFELLTTAETLSQFPAPTMYQLLRLFQQLTGRYGCHP